MDIFTCRPVVASLYLPCTVYCAFCCILTVFTSLLLLSACLSEPATESWQLCHVAAEHSGLEPVHQQEPDEKRTEAKCCSVSVFELFHILSTTNDGECTHTYVMYTYLCNVHIAVSCNGIYNRNPVRVPHCFIKEALQMFSYNLSTPSNRLNNKDAHNEGLSYWVFAVKGPVCKISRNLGGSIDRKWYVVFVIVFSLL